jgi:hypothetical protein
MSTKEKQENPADVRTYVRERYSKIAQDFSPETAASCCGPEVSDRSCCGPEVSATVISADQLYEMSVNFQRTSPDFLWAAETRLLWHR